MAKNEVATTDKKFELVTLTGELAEAIAEEMDGLEVSHSRGQRFRAVVVWHLNFRERQRTSL